MMSSTNVSSYTFFLSGLRSSPEKGIPPPRSGREIQSLSIVTSRFLAWGLLRIAEYRDTQSSGGLLATWISWIWIWASDSILSVSSGLAEPFPIAARLVHGLLRNWAGTNLHRTTLARLPYSGPVQRVLKIQPRDVPILPANKASRDLPITWTVEILHTAHQPWTLKACDSLYSPSFCTRPRWCKLARPTFTWIYFIIFAFRSRPGMGQPLRRTLCGRVGLQGRPGRTGFAQPPPFKSWKSSLKCGMSCLDQSCRALLRISQQQHNHLQKALWYA